MIDRYLANRDLIESSIVHILDDDVIPLDTSDDTDMAIVSIVSSSGELYDRSNYWLGSYLDTIGSSISHPG